MNITFYDIVIFFQWGCMLASFGMALYVRYAEKASGEIKHFFWYPVVAAGLTFFAFNQKYFHLYDDYIFGILKNMLLLFHFSFLSIFLFKILPNKKIWVTFLAIFIFLLFGIALCLLTNDIRKTVPTALAITNFGLVIFCSIYYFQLFDAIPTSNLVKNPIFWIVNGIFFCMCATIPVLALKYYFINLVSAPVLATIEVSIPLSYGIMHIFFIKAYVCILSLTKHNT